MYELDDTYDDALPMFCDCGVTLALGEEQCSACAGAPHERLCGCEECTEYWSELARATEAAADAFRTGLLCSCGWTGMYAEHHRDRSADCTIALRKATA